MTENSRPEAPKEGSISKISRTGLQVAGGAIPFAGGLLSAIAGQWGEREQTRWNDFFHQWVKMLEDELKEKEQTILEIVMRLNLQDEEINRRVSSDEYQSLLKKAFREWGGTESESKREYIRNILTNAAATRITSDDVVRLFIDWISKYSEMHFSVIAAIYNSGGISRGAIWEKIGKGPVREDSPDADLYKLLFLDLSTGHVIRQHRPVDAYGNFIKKNPKSRSKGQGSRTLKSAFDYDEGYELTALGNQFVHYAMTDLPLRIDYKPDMEE
ncbi:hypothetical protein [Pseudodesulfovibrio methanolicus]|uniref:Uncharacterized protein n=1 Tax=Pseudodesulfovibrio methanolicus TaxID=3126690 RepID=A0ABZ2ISM8_9BACT